MKVRERWGGQPFDRHALELWQRSTPGRRLLELEEAELARTMPELFGRHFLQIGSWGRGNRLIGASQMLHSAVLGTVRGFDEQALAEPEHLPVMAKSVDAVLLPHCLEFVRSPQSVLREVNRILTDRGRVLILGFNPWSFWGLRKGLGLRHRAFPQGARLVSVGRLRDWLELLDFEVCELRRFGLGFPWNAPHSEGLGNAIQRAFDALADCYLVVAKKRVIPMTLVGRRLRAAVPAIVPAPATEARRAAHDQA
ncbi:MAG TPA: methyltransferase domain-containing protein [Nevskiaceae bacterium]|nr:methyltransferase domain-containing protein [Nevskiaceae bacterium]